MPSPPVVLSIAGYDPSSGAGITADIKTAAAHGCYAVTCITALTAQSTQGVFAVEALRPGLVNQTLEVLLEDLEIAAVRIGMLGSTEVAAAVLSFLGGHKLPNVVLDPVLRSSSGTPLLDERGLDLLRDMLPLCDVITPNIAESAILSGAEPIPENSSWDAVLPEVRRLAARLHHLGAKTVVITGGHLTPANDLLSDWRSGKPHEEVFPGERIPSRSTHGTGCAFATAIACQLAFGKELREAVRAAKEYVRKAILAAYPLGKGTGPVNHFG
ncbi:MAG TPA: bifunctional hydroxymethylpyrimidine kinase/phosphomethylpyrimidine kinase [Terriglobales bacterium]|nr:bifunctional hydroxymethylpyrimidine kinase/phosphomethylpyrimidine kinase [Terriglobales bacterium]